MAYKYPNRWLYAIPRLIKGQQPVFLEYAVDMSPRWTGPEGNPHLAAVMRSREGVFASGLAELAGMEPVVAALDEGRIDGLSFNWTNGFLPALDALTIMWAASQAKRTFFEIGSGNSTLAARAAITHFRRDVRIVSVDPQPRVEIDALCDEVIRAPLEATDLSPILALEPGDVLFVDSSHRSFMNSDVTVVMTEILPALKPGVIFGIHDIMLPYDYPERWTKRAYSEQYLLAAVLLANPEYFDIRFANQWISRQGQHVAPLEGIWSRLGAGVRDRGGSAFWGIKRGL
jgi:hypothetical protein